MSETRPLPTEPAYMLSQPPRFAVSEFVWGASFIFRAWRFLNRYRLWHLASLAILVHFLLFAGLSFGLWKLVWPFLETWTLRLETMGQDGETIHRVVQLLLWALWLMAVPIVFVAGAVLVLLLGQLVASPFLDVLSERVECIVMRMETQPTSWRRTFEAIFLSLSDCVWGFVYLGLLYIPLLLLGFVPGIGAIVSFVVGAFVLAQEFMGAVLSRHLVSYRARWQLVLRNRWSALGFGGMIMVLFVLPGVNLLVLPLVCVAGTLLICALRQSDRLSPVLEPHLLPDPEPQPAPIPLPK